MRMRCVAGPLRRAIAASALAAGLSVPSPARAQQGASAPPEAAAALRNLELSKMVWPEIVVPLAPTVFSGKGQRHLAYELYLTNVGRAPCVLQRVEAVDEEGGASLLDATPPALTSALAHPAKADAPEAERATLAGGERVVYYVWIDLPRGAAAPKRIGHRLTFKRPDDPAELVISAASTPVVPVPRTIASPLRGASWVAANGPSNASGHRRTVIALDGQPRIAQRFAIDWVQIDKEGNTFAGNRADNRSYRCYGQEALAVAPGVVAAVKDGIPENTPESDPAAPPISRAVPITLETVGGNHVILDLGDGVYAFYAHLQPGSLRVKAGDHVKTGDVLGLVGNSGNSTEPHLHFHLGDRGSPLASQGLPYALPAFRVSGTAVIEGDGAPRVDWLARPETRQNEIPLENEIVDHPR
jgi:murein DD-endopeptidase MepM/ murein hydrolase activator NlpD